MAVTLPADVARRYRRFSLYNSPYAAHDRGRAVDLYPAGDAGVSPVAGVVRDVRTLGCPDRPYAVDRDHLVLVDLADDWLRAAGVDPDEEWVARVLHVDPAVEPGDCIAVGDTLGELIRSGFFGPWVNNHVHLGFRRGEQNPYRASGSRPVAVGIDVAPMAWDGTGTVVETGRSYALLDAPEHPAPDTGRFAAIADDDGRPLDGGLAHYTGGGVLADGEADDDAVTFLGERVGEAGGRDLAWGDVDVLANGRQVTGLSLFAAQDGDYGAKLVTRDVAFEVGETVRVTVRPSDDPIRLGVGH